MRVKNLCENAKYIVKKTDTPMEHLEKKSTDIIIFLVLSIRIVIGVVGT